MNVFSCFRFYLSLMLITPSVFSQSVIESMSDKYDQLETGRWKLSEYLWSYAKNKAAKYDKPILDFNAIDNWQILGDYLSVSPNGKHFAYSIERAIKPVNFDGKQDSLVVQAVNSSRRLVFTNAWPGFFTGDSKLYVFKKETALGFLQLDQGDTRYVKDVASYKTPNKGRNEWIAYQQIEDSDVVLQNLVTGKKKTFPGISNYEFYDNSGWFVCQRNPNDNKNGWKELLLYHLATGTEKRYSFAVDYSFSEGGETLLLKIVKKVNEEDVTDLEYVSFPDGKRKVIWSASGADISINNCGMDKPGQQVVFTARDSTWYYHKGMDKAVLKVTNEMTGIGGEFQISGSASFTDNGRYIKFLLQSRPSLTKADPAAVQLDVWNHKDLTLQSAQANSLRQPHVYNAIINVASGQIIQLETEGRTLHFLQGDFAIVKRRCKDTYGDRFWERGYGYERDSNWLVNLKDGSRHLLGSKERDVTAIGPFWFSPGGNYLVYFDFDTACRYFCYDLRTGKLTDLSAHAGDMQPGYIDPYLRSDKKPRYPLGLVAWLEEDAGVLIYDNNDIWQFDLRGRKPAINLTNAVGRSNDIIFSLFNGQRFDNTIPVLAPGASLLLRAFSRKNKYSGFYRKVIGTAGDPEPLYMGKYFTNMIPWCQDPNLSNKGMPPVKAGDVDTWIVQRQSDTDAPNYYKTADFKSFERLTDFQPQKRYNWLFEELHTFKHLDGKSGQGILYKPENFDPSRKYPVLVVFYGGYSNNLFQFPIPAYNTKAITPGVSPIWFLNNGYLIFTPDIYVAPLKYGPEAFNVIEGAAAYLEQLPYVDAGKLACASHSWSAKLGAYLFTHSKSFGAMSISEGFLYANMINVALSIHMDGQSKLEDVEEGFQFGNLWENKDSWLDQTTVLHINKAESPLLLFCNKESSEEYQDQTLQFFTASRRLEKKVWWLKYDKGGHTLSDLNEQKDYTIRCTQFFDHYLKEAPAPRWMTQGIPAKLKGFEAGYELDPLGHCGKDCKICKKWNGQYKKDPGMFGKPIGEWRVD